MKDGLREELELGAGLNSAVNLPSHRERSRVRGSSLC